MVGRGGRVRYISVIGNPVYPAVPPPPPQNICTQTSSAGGFVLACEELGRLFDLSFPACTFFLMGRLPRAHLFHFLCQDQSTVAQRAETTVAECSLTRCE